MSLINTINSITGIDLDTFAPRPNVGGYSTHGGYCGPAVKPIALNLVQQVGGDADWRLPVSRHRRHIGMARSGGVYFARLRSVQVCTAVMHYGFRIVEDMIDGLKNWMGEKGFHTIEDFRGLSLSRVVEWQDLDLNYRIVARIDEAKCIGCELCHTACQDGAYQCIHMDRVKTVTRGITMTPIPKA